MTGNGTTGFGQKASAVIEKCKSMANYMGTLETNVTEAPMNFNAGLRKASADGKLNDSPKFKSAVDASGMNMNDSGMYKKDEFGTEIPEDSDTGGKGGVTGTLTEFDSSDYTRGGEPAKVGQKRTDGGKVLFHTKSHFFKLVILNLSSTNSTRLDVDLFGVLFE